MNKSIPPAQDRALSPGRDGVVESLRATLKATEQSRALVYFPWYGSFDAQLTSIATSLNLVALRGAPSDQHPYSPRGLIRIIDATIASGLSAKSEHLLTDTRSALSEWPSSEKLMQCAVSRIQTVLAKEAVRGILVYSSGSMPGAEQWQTQALHLADELTSKSSSTRIIVTGDFRPKSKDALVVVRIPWAAFLEDVRKLAADELTPEPPGQESLSPFRKFVAFLSHLVTPWDSDVSEATRPDDVLLNDERWFSLVARLCFPDGHLAVGILKAWCRFDTTMTTPRASAEAPPHDLHVATKLEYQILRS
jgi:hypothetical protein